MRKIAISLSIIFTLVSFSCTLFLPDEDETGPVIVLESPSNGEVVSEQVIVSCTAEDDAGVAGTELFIDHEGTGLIDTTAPYSFEWNSEDYVNGTSYIIYVQGWDANDNYANSDTITVIVDNTSAHPDPVEDMLIETVPEGFHITWEAINHERFVSYTLNRSTEMSMNPAVALYTTTVATDTTYLDSTANPLQSYYYQVFVIDSTNHVSSGTVEASPSPAIYIPSGLVTTVSDTSVRLRWNDNSSFEESFIIQRDEGAGFADHAIVAANLTEYVDTFMEYDKLYRYRMAVRYDGLISEYSNIAGANSPLQFAPSNVVAMATTQTILVSWDDNCTFEDGFRLERRGGLGWDLIAELGPDITTYEDADLTYDINYYYRVKAFTATMESDYSTFYSVYSPLVFAPTNLALQTNDTSIVLTWEDQCLFETGFIIQRGEGSITGYGYVTIDSVDADVTTYTDFNIEEDDWYYYRVAAYTPEERSSYSSTSGISSPISFAPNNISATALDTSIQIRWTDNCLFEDGFQLERDAGSGFEIIAELDADITGYNDPDMEYGIVYHYRVAAVADGELSDYSWEVARLSPLQFAPSSVTVSSVGNDLQLVWNDNCIFEAGYLLERDAGAGYTVIATLGPNTTSYLDTDMSYDLLYRYRVSAFTSTDQSNYAYSYSIRSPLNFAPSQLNAYVHESTIDLSWQDNCIFEAGFHIERDAGSGFVLLADVGADVTTYSDADLGEGIIYRYRVSAYTASMESDYSFSVTANSPIEFAPTNLQAVTQANSIDLSWVDNCTFEDGFKIERDDGTGFVEIADLGANFTFYSDSDLEYYTIYRYRIAAYEGAELSNYTSILNVQSPVNITPSNLVATSYDTEILLEWEDNSDVEEGFRIQRDDGTGFIQIDEVLEDVTSYTDYTPVYGTEYTYRVLAFANGQESDYTNEVTGSVGWLYSEWETITSGTYTIGHADVPSGVFDHVLADDFEMMRYEVTNIQFAAFMEEAFVAGEITPEEDGSAFRGGAVDSIIYNLSMSGSRINWDGSAFTIDVGYELHPVVGVSWHGADAFASFYGWSLPSEIQWEIAARGDTEFDYPWGNNDPTCDLANFSGCSDELLPVGQTSGVSPFNIYDMVGNVWEWTDTFYDVADDSYVIKGGSWSNYTDNLKVWYRSEGNPDVAYTTLGFRCVR